MASTARAMAGISRSTAAATLRSSALMMRNASSVGKASRDADRGLGCSVRSFSTTGSTVRLTPVIRFGGAGPAASGMPGWLAGPRRTDGAVGWSRADFAARGGGFGGLRGRLMRFCAARGRIAFRRKRERRFSGWKWGWKRWRKRRDGVRPGLPLFPAREGAVLWFLAVAAEQPVRLWVRWGVLGGGPFRRSKSSMARR